MQDDYKPDIISLTDENGEEFSLEVLDAIDLEGEHYLALVPAGKDADKDDGTLVVLKEVYDDGDFYYEEIEDDDEYNEVGDIFAERLKEFYEVDRD